MTSLRYRPGSVLAASPVYLGSEQFFPAFLEAWRRLSYPAVKYCLVENNVPESVLPRWLVGFDCIRCPGDLHRERVAAKRKGSRNEWETLTDAQNRIRKIFLEGDSEFLFLNETSRPCPADLVDRLVAYRKDVVGAVYKSTYNSGFFCVYDFETKTERNVVDRYALINESTKLVRVGGIGFGAILIHRSVLEQVTFRSGKRAADSYFAADLESLGIPIYAAPVTVPNLKIEWNEVERRRWERDRRTVIAYARTNVQEISDKIYSGRVRLAMQAIAGLITPKDRFVLVDQDKWDGQEIVKASRRFHFLHRNGAYGGLPANDQAAIQEVERLRDAGARLIAFGWQAFWYLDYYPELGRWLRTTFPCVLSTEDVVAFDLGRLSSIDESEKS